MTQADLSREPPSVYACFMASAARWPEQPFLVVPAHTADVYGIAPGETTYAQAAALVEALRAAYAGAGLVAGRRAGLMLGNQPAFFWHWLALNALGVSVVPVNAEFREAELAYLIADADLTLAVAPGTYHDRLRAAAARNGASLALVDSTAAAPLQALGAQLAAHAAAREASLHEAGPADESSDSSRPPVTTATSSSIGLATECALLYTSGTTGLPKGCILPNEYFIYAGAWYRDLGGACTLTPGQDRLLSPLPLVHMNAMACSSMAMMITGSAIILVDRFHPDTWWQTVRSARASIIHYLGVMPAMLIGAPPADSDREHAVRFGFGAGVDRRHHAAFEARFGIPLIEGWAMTETGVGGCIIAHQEPRKIGSNCFGRPPAWVDWRIVTEDGRDCAVDEPGELLVRRAGPVPDYGFFKGYLNKASATREAWADGWFHTGDVVRRDADGDLHFIDRRKNVIRRSGENIAAVEVEGVLLQHESVAAAGVVPVPDSIRGDEVMACVVLAPGFSPSQATAEAIVRHCLGQLAYFKAPGYVNFVGALPLTPTQKIQRAELRTLAVAAVRSTEGARCFDLRSIKKRDAHA